MRHTDVLIVGGGLAGLSCATELAKRGIDFHLLEATDRCGGRVRTDTVDGFVLDHGFQVLLTAYPACQQLLDYDALDLRRFEPGAMVRHANAFTTVSDPLRTPSRLLQTVFSPIGTLGDKWRIAKLRRQARAGSLEDLYARPQTSTLQRLQEIGFSSAMIDGFFRPWFGGIFLERELATSSRMLEFVFRMLSTGHAAVPAAGMQQIPMQLLSRLPSDRVRTCATVGSISETTVRLTDGASIGFRQAVIATESNAAARLLSSIAGESTENRLPQDWNGVTNLCFAATNAPNDSPLLVLGGDESGPINNLAILSNIAPEYAPAGQSLISVSVVGKPILSPAWELEQPVREQLTRWYGDQVANWRLLRIFDIPFALPQQTVEWLQPVRRLQRHGSVIVCGDHCQTRSIHGAMESGLQAANISAEQL